GQWHHVAGTYDGANLQLYIDGHPRGVPAAHAGAISPMLANSFVAIGSEDGRMICPTCIGTRYFNGQIDEAAIYNRALSPSEILGIYLAGVNGKCPLSPGITVQPPTNQVMTASSIGSVSVVAVGTPTLSYQWYFNNGPLTNGGRFSG